MDEQEYQQELAERMIDELKEQGYKSFRERDNDRRYQQAVRDYEHHLNCPFG